MTSTETPRAGDALSAALKTAAFISPVPWEGRPPAPRESCELVSIVWRGEPRAALELLAAPEFGRYLAAAQLGVETATEEARMGGPDAVKELVNITAGLLARDLLHRSAHASLVLGLPQCRPAPVQETWRDFAADPHTDFLSADGHLLAVRIRCTA